MARHSIQQSGIRSRNAAATSGRRRSGARRGLAVVVAAAVLAPSTVACTELFTSLVEQLARLDCRTDAAVRASDDRTGMVFVHDHVYQAPGEQDRDWYTTFLNESLPRTYDDVNAYLDARQVGVLVGLLRKDLTQNAAMAPVDVTAGGWPQGDSVTVLTDTARAAPQFLHVHWSPSATTPGVGGYGGGILPDAFWLGIIEGPDTRQRTEEQRRRTFAHELGHVLALGHTDVAGNLMNDDLSGDELTPQQIADMRRALNERRAEWLVLSCRNDEALLGITRDNTAEEIVDAACGRSERRGTPPRRQPPNPGRTNLGCR
jgi:hypothetical protein